ncbi:hypothetical protein DICSQDRAFT_153148 [Dichomitus squalens LYAD-421 SS1]|uniref:uncharacterized protein n=1 Tax=Dichomitus squalens (strain LYAD-421) TaxID=732165 RepID=UPI00044152A2|nr:uncharacterized protein DICSQDRAFT_153148 [Dichomitus squalens LYAD-421 SS1]EJF64988.1 hypothetical protein DICSQDRAFT_153148 [Dichomitus squalens LYAD-421 SS1]
MDEDDHPLLKVPDFLKHHPELRKRGINLTLPLKPYAVYQTDPLVDTGFAVKILDPDTQEAAICEKLQANLKSPNHAIPAEVIRSSSRSPILLMPCLRELDSVPYHDASLSFLLSVFHQIAEGLEDLHRHRIAHLDMCPDNLVLAHERHAAADRRVEGKKIYIIDFHTSRQLELPPGAQPAILLPYTQIDPPPGIKHFDPYSWDVYCLGHVFENRLQVYCYRRPEPRVVRWLIQWLIGTERGCKSACHCRPSAKRVRQMLTVIRGLVYTFGLLSSVPAIVRRLIPRPATD